MSHFTPEQLKELADIFGLTIPADWLPVRDGVVKKGEMIWWRAIGGPEQVNSEHDWTNIRNHPDLYQRAKPRAKVTYED